MIRELNISKKWQTLRGDMIELGRGVFMPLVCLHYSRLFRKKLERKEMRGGILKGKWKIPLGTEAFVYVSEADSVEEGMTDHKIGIAKILSCQEKKVKELTEAEAKAEGYPTRKELLEAVKFWHKLGDEDFITFIEFDLELI